MPRFAVLALGLGLAACAVGTTEVVGGGSGDDGGTSDDASTTHSDSGRNDAGSTGNDAGMDLDGGTTPDGGGTDSGGIDGGGTTIPCNSPNACASASAIGTLSGDTSSPDVTSSGTTSKWLTLIATENDSSPLATPMKLSVTLTSPGTENFDLYVYLGGSPGAVECSTIKQSSTNGTGQTDTVSIQWGESGTFANNSDDTRTITIEVRAASTPCDSTATWSLTAHGH